MWRTYAAWMDGALESDIGLIRAAMEGSAVPSSAELDNVAQARLMLAERVFNTESGLPREGSPVAEFGTRFVTRCGTLATQVPEEQEKKRGGEGGIARGRGRPLVLRFAPDRRGRARGVQKSLRDFCRTRWVRPHTLLRRNKKGSAEDPFLFQQWRRGWDSNPRAGITRPSDFESAPL